MESNKRTLIERILIDFDNAIVDLEALNEYYIQTRDFIIGKRTDYDKKYDISFEISRLLDSVYDKDISERCDYLEEIKRTEIKPGIFVSDVININFNETNDSLQYSLCKDYQNYNYDPSTARRKKRSISNQENIFAKSILSNIIISFEQFLASIYETLILASPKCYFEDKKINVCELIDGDMDELFRKLIYHEVESNMFDSLKTLDKIKTKSKIDIDRFIPIRKEFEEIYYRRNVFVHNDGYVNEMYLDSVDEKYKKDTAKGERLICDVIYLDNSITVLQKIIASLHYEILTINHAEQDDYNSLANFGFEALRNKNYDLAEYVYGILRRHRGFQYIYKAMYEVNYINALKLQGKDIKRLLNDFDVSIATDNYKIAKECLCDNNEKVYELLNETYPNSFNALMIREWPLFIKFRETEFYERFINEYKEDFEKYVFEKEPEDV